MTEFDFHRPGPKDETEPGYVYHATNVENAYDIADSGHLRVHRPWHGTDQGAWPDGSTERRAYFSGKAHFVHYFAPEHGQSAVLRVKRKSHPFKRESTDDIYTTKKIPTKHIDVRHADGSWHPISKLAAKKEDMMVRRLLLIDWMQPRWKGRSRVEPDRGRAEGKFREYPRKKRIGGPLKDEPIHYGVEPLKNSLGLVRDRLLIDH